MAREAVSDVMDRQPDDRVRAELRRPGAGVPDVAAERFAGKAWVIGDVDTQSFMDAVVAIERLCEVGLTQPQMVEPAGVADVTAAPMDAPFRAGRLSGPPHLIDPAAFDW